jgi:Icc-related predicted phosphoesterase
MVKTRFLYATDVHGSEACWRKFLNSAKVFKTNAIVLSGDMTGKIIVPMIVRPDGKYNASLLGEDHVLTEQEIPDFAKRCRMMSYIPYKTTPEEAAKLKQSGWGSPELEGLFVKMECEVVKYWMDLIAEKVPKECRVIISPGNDDKHQIDQVIIEAGKSNPQIVYGEEDVISLDPEHEVACCGWTNPTPWKSPRECSEEELLAKLEKIIAKVKDMQTAVFCFHCPPYQSDLDTAPLLVDFKPVIVAGSPVFIPAGSKAIRLAIEKYQPLLGLHGHIHESAGLRRIGRTDCLNPGSEYSEGIFKGYMVEIDGAKLTKCQRIEG